MTAFSAPSAELFFSRNDNLDIRLGDIAKRGWKPSNDLKPNERVFTICGYPDDEGIRLNGGRLGAAKGPDQIRKYLYKMTPDLSYSDDKNKLHLDDIGNLIIETTNAMAESALGQRHDIAEKNIFETLGKNHRALTFGGGHDYGYPDGAAFASYCEKLKVRPLVLNFDAHLDVRPTDKGFSSGTPFFRLLERFSNIDFAEIGVQSQCNSTHHLRWAKERGARILTHDDFLFSGESFEAFVTRRLEPWLIRPRPTFLSIDIDGFSNAYAPGCSQAWATGFSPEPFLKLLQILLRRLDVRILSIYEVSPPLDQDDRTAKLAALIAHRFLFNA